MDRTILVIIFSIPIIALCILARRIENPMIKFLIVVGGTLALCAILILVAKNVGVR